MNTGEVQRVRMHAALHHLKEISQSQYEDELERAEALKNIRNQGIAEIENKFGLCQGEDGLHE